MTNANTNAGGISLAGSDPMDMSSGPNTAPNSMGIPNVYNYICCGGNEQNLGTIRVSTIDSGANVGVVSGTNSAKLDPLKGSSKYFLHGQPSTRLGDISMTNNRNMMSNQVSPSQSKYFINT